jgi:hypothetical protein
VGILKVWSLDDDKKDRQNQIQTVSAGLAQAFTADEASSSQGHTPSPLDVSSAFRSSEPRECKHAADDLRSFKAGYAAQSARAVDEFWNAIPVSIIGAESLVAK